MAAIPRTTQTHLAWRQGDTAHLEAQPDTAHLEAQPDLNNPYHPSTDSYRAWQRGWHGEPFDERGGFEATGVVHSDTEEVAA